MNTYQKIFSFSNSLINHSLNSFKTVPFETHQERLKTCFSCDKFNKQNETCLECGCFLRIKASWATEKCPLDKWGPELSPNQTESPVAEQQNNPTPPCGCV